MLRYILKTYGHRAQLLTTAKALEHVMGGGVPHDYAVTLLSLAESRCRLLKTQAELRDSGQTNYHGKAYSTQIDKELSVQLVASSETPHAITQTQETAIEDTATQRQLAYEGIQDPSSSWWHYGPTPKDPEPSKRWHTGCGGEVLTLKDNAGDGVHATYFDCCSKCDRVEVLKHA